MKWFYWKPFRLSAFGATELQLYDVSPKKCDSKRTLIVLKLSGLRGVR
jgi:hypothetical protein